MQRARRGEREKTCKEITFAQVGRPRRRKTRVEEIQSISCLFLEQCVRAAERRGAQFDRATTRAAGKLLFVCALTSISLAFPGLLSSEAEVEKEKQCQVNARQLAKGCCLHYLRFKTTSFASFGQRAKLSRFASCMKNFSLSLRAAFSRELLTSLQAAAASARWFRRNRL